MVRWFVPTCLLLLAMSAFPTHADEDPRVRVDLPPMMEAHMLANMRDHLETVDTLLGQLVAGDFDAAADLAEVRLGMSSLGLHGAGHMAPHMPDGMRAAGTAMHRAASRFARIAEEGDPGPAFAALHVVTTTCVACHRGYRVR